MATDRFTYAASFLWEKSACAYSPGYFFYTVFFEVSVLKLLNCNLLICNCTSLYSCSVYALRGFAVGALQMSFIIIRDVKFASGITNIIFGFYPYTDVC